MKIKKEKKKINKELFTYDYDIIDGLGELNAEYIKKFIDLHTHESVVDANYFLLAQSALTRQYESELALLYSQARSKTDEKFYLAEKQASACAIYSRRRRFKWHDSPVKQILDKRINDELRGHLNKLSEGLESTDIAAEFLDYILKQFVPKKHSRKRIFKKRSGYLYWVLTEYSQECDFDELLRKFVDELVPERKRECFLTKNGEYLKSVLLRALNAMQEPEPEPEPVPAPADEQTDKSSEGVQESPAKVLVVPEDANQGEVFDYTLDGEFDEDDIDMSIFEQDEGDDIDELEMLEGKYFGNDDANVGVQGTPEQLELVPMRVSEEQVAPEEPGETEDVDAEEETAEQEQSEDPAEPAEPEGGT